MDPRTVDELLRVIAREFLDEVLWEGSSPLPEGTTGFRIRVDTVGFFSQQRHAAVFADGSTTRVVVEPDGSFYAALRDLREVTSSADRGAFFVVEFAVGFDGSIEASYDFDGEPDFGEVPATRGQVVGDLARFPRSPEHTPAWLRRYVKSEEGPA